MDSAQREYEMAIPVKLGIADIRTLDRLARIVAVRGNVVKAVELWKTALRISPGDFSVMWNLSVALKDIGDVVEATRLQERIKGMMKHNVP